MNVSLRREAEVSGKVTRVLVLVGYAVFGLLGILFLSATVLGLFGLIPSVNVDTNERTAAYALVLIGALGASYSIWRLRAHVKRHGKTRQ